mgnify:CR=1 FL=1
MSKDGRSTNENTATIPGTLTNPVDIRTQQTFKTRNTLATIANSNRSTDQISKLKSKMMTIKTGGDYVKM